MAKSLSELVGDKKKISLYIHVPFCKQKCLYCDFVSYTYGSVENYFEALVHELMLYNNVLKRGIKTLYFGGGTPSFVNEHYIEKIVKHLSQYLFLEEFTIEVNPDSFDKEKAKIYKEIGVNRISLGLQSLDDIVLKKAGRIHTADQAIKAYELANQYYEVVNVDFILGLPGESWSSIERTVEFVEKYKPEHLSIYILELHENTPLVKTYKKLKNETYDYHDALLEFLESVGYERYEISNFSLNKNYCKHNLVYWANLDYIGVGLSAGGHVERIRYNNVSSFQKYYEKIRKNEKPVEYFSKNNSEKETLESIFMMLRTKWGIDRSLLPDLPKLETLLKFLSSQFEFFDGNKLSKNGMDQSNAFFGELLKLWEEFYEA
ncbi:radical SAM family heme chaperone HemW [Thermosipho ferrireducens]|uniref:Heme chaperone HemW n=1 Tax=Thermosipho ferrireducens TaxID=2571116 RepID=A0ABX7S7K9_9BACT|nr:radical SAM family heme chaperone HemW [Thermosipho ferrireducens]QTA38576.1 radical SAM family heme chaperone HemW [Thermosipho ferrireducens]